MEKVDPKVLVNQKKNAIKYCGATNPECIDDYIAFDGYKAKEKVLKGEVDVIKLASDALLVDRRKQDELCCDNWKGADVVVCETLDALAAADNKVLIEAPHVIVESMLIVMEVSGAKEGYIVAKDDLAFRRVSKAVNDAKAYGLLDKEISVVKESKEGLNVNAEILANLLVIVQDSYKTLPEKGFKGVAIGGKVKNPGIYNVENGITYRQLIEEVAGGATGNVKAIKVGAPYGEYLSASELDKPVNFMSLMMNGIIRGTALVVVIDDTTDMAKEISDYLQFLLIQSCGKCFPCKVGVKRMDEMVKKIVEDIAEKDDYSKVKAIAKNMSIGTLCPIGQKGAAPILSALENFSSDFIKE